MEAPTENGKPPVPEPIKEDIVQGQRVVVNKRDMNWTPEEEENIAKATVKNQDVVFLLNEVEQEKTLEEGHHKVESTVYFKNCKAGTYTVNHPCTKILVEGCHDCNITLNAQVKTEVMEVWKCHATKITVNTSVKTLQADLSKELSFHFPKSELFNQLVWGGVYDFHVTFGDNEQSLN